MISISSFKKVVNNYDYFLFDQWGVLHNGSSKFPMAEECLSFLKKKDKCVILVSNSSRPTKFSINNLLSHSKPNQIYSNKLSLNKISANINDINKYFFAIIIFIFSLFLITILLTISNLDFEVSFKLGILTIMNTVNSEMYTLANLDFYNFNIFGKISLITFMIIGRIELLTVIILLKKFLFKN